MTRQEIQALIDAKIKGQGTAVDAGSVLPAILTGILDLIEQGGGGGTADAVQYIPQELTAPQQMQARKNQGLYYEETSEGEKTVTTPDSPDAEWPYPDENGISYGNNYFMRITDDAPTQADIIEMIITDETTVAGSDLQSLDITGFIDFPSTVQGYSANPFVSSRQMFIVVSEDTVVDGSTYKRGIYVPNIQLFANPYVSEITYNGETTTIHHIEPKYIKDMYYEEEGVKTINYDINGSRVGSYTKVSDEIIEASAVIGHKFTSYSSDNGNTEYTITEDMVIAADSTHPTRILFDSSDPNSWAILIFPEDMEFEEDSFSKGVWFGDGGTIVHPNHIESLEYEGVTVHQIPSKYIPQTIPAVKIEIPSNERVSYGIGYVLLNNYVTDRDVVFSIEGKTINQVAVRNMLDTTSTGDVWSFGTGNTYNFGTSGYYLVEIEVRVTSGYDYYYATVFVETVNQ